jgi:hypothetical protein
MFKIGAVVKVVRSVDEGCPAERIGEIGTVVKTGDGSTLDNMVSVKFADGENDAYWPEELEPEKVTKSKRQL